MRGWLLLLFLPAIVQAAEPVQTCPGIAPASVWTACTKVVCATPTSNEDMVQTQSATGKIWVKLGTVPATGTLARCAALNGNWWATRQALGIANPPTPPVTPHEGPTAVSIGDTLTWSPVEDAISYRIYHGTTSGVWGPEPLSVTTTRYPLLGFPPGKHYFAVTSVNSSGESAKVQAPTFEVPQPQQPPETPKKLVCSSPVVSGMQVSFACTYQ